MRYEIKLMGLDGQFDASYFGTDHTTFLTEAEAHEAAKAQIEIFKESDRGIGLDEEISYQYIVVELSSILAKNLTEDEREEFADLFYEKVDLDDCEDDNPNPWGCPWVWPHEVALEGNCIEECVDNFIFDNEDEIKKLREFE